MGTHLIIRVAGGEKIILQQQQILNNANKLGDAVQAGSQSGRDTDGVAVRIRASSLHSLSHIKHMRVHSPHPPSCCSHARR